MGSFPFELVMGIRFASTVLDGAMGIRGRGAGAVPDEVMGIRIAGPPPRGTSSGENEHSSKPLPFELVMGIRRTAGAVLDGAMGIRVADFLFDEVMGIRTAGDSSTDGNEHSSRPFPFEHIIGILILEEPTAIFIRTLSRGTSSDGSCVCGPELDASGVAGASVDDDVDPVLVLEDRWTIIVRDTVRTRA